MDWFDANQLATGTCAVTTLDQVFVENYNGVSGDDFQVFYTQQAANFVVPQTVTNSDGTHRILGAPVAGLTNAQAGLNTASPWQARWRRPTPPR